MMAYKIGTATDYLGLLEDLKDFVSNPNDVSAAVADPGNTGNGTCSQPTAVDTAVSETWTITIKAVTTDFTVVGSVSGAKADGLVGTPYNNGIVSFEVTAGGTPFVQGDFFTFTVTKVMGTEKWEVLEYTQNFDAANNDICYLKGPGSSASDEIYVGIRTVHSDATPYYAWMLSGFTNYVQGVSFYSQQGARAGSSVNIPWMLLDDQSMKYWFFANGRRFMGCIRVGTIYAPFYMGFPLVYGVPNSYPYPLVIGGSAAYGTDGRYTTTSERHRGWPDPWMDYRDGYATVGCLMVLSGSWYTFGNYTSEAYNAVGNNNCVWPGNHCENTAYPYWSNRIPYLGDPTPDGAHPLFPLILCQDQLEDNIIGEFQGAYFVHGDGVVAEDSISYAGDDFIVFQNTYHAAPHNHFAMKLE
jgi:hypothetical protein